MAGRRGSVSSSGVQLIIDQSSMATVNNWLGFSLSPQELPSSAAAAGDVSAADVCFNIPQDWSSMRGSELSALVQAEPKLEDFLGGISSYSEHHNKARSSNMDINGAAACYASSGYQLYQHHHHQATSANSLHFADSVMVASSAPGIHNLNHDAAANGAGNNGGIGLSMIKSWLRSQPAPGQRAAEGLSLSMNMPLLQAAAAAETSSLSTSAAAQQGSRKENNGSTSAGSGAVVSAGTTAAAESAGAVVESPAAGRKTADTFGQRTSIYRGVTRHRWTGRYEAHLWDNSCRREGQTRKGRQVYLGGYDKEEKAARAYDLAALKYWGPTTTTNFPVDNYEKELEEMKHMTRQEFVASLRRKSSGFSRGASIYRGVTRHHQHGRWQARIGRVAGNKDLYLGTFSTQEEAAEAYDIAAIKFRGLNAVTNFDMSRYDVKSILDSSAALPLGGGTKRLKDAAAADHHHQQHHPGGVVSYAAAPQLDSAAIAYGAPYYHHHQHHSSAAWPAIAFQAAPQAASSGGHGHLLYHPYGQPPLMRGWCKQEQEQGQQQEEADHAVIAAAHSLQDLHHLNLGAGAGAHDFFSQHAAHAMHGLGSVDNNNGAAAASLEHSTGSNSVVYNGDATTNNNSYMLPPMSAAAAAAGFSIRDQQDDGGKMAYESFLLGAPGDGYGGGTGRMAAAWITPVSVSAAQPVAATSSGSDMAGAVCHGGAQLFSVWNDDA